MDDNDLYWASAVWRSDTGVPIYKTRQNLVSTQPQYRTVVDNGIDTEMQEDPAEMSKVKFQRALLTFPRMRQDLEEHRAPELWEAMSTDEILANIVATISRMLIPLEWNPQSRQSWCMEESFGAWRAEREKRQNRSILSSWKRVGQITSHCNNKTQLATTTRKDLHAASLDLKDAFAMVKKDQNYAPQLVVSIGVAQLRQSLCHLSCKSSRQKMHLSQPTKSKRGDARRGQRSGRAWLHGRHVPPAVAKRSLIGMARRKDKTKVWAPTRHPPATSDRGGAGGTSLSDGPLKLPPVQLSPELLPYEVTLLHRVSVSVPHIADLQTTSASQ